MLKAKNKKKKRVRLRIYKEEETRGSSKNDS